MLIAQFAAVYAHLTFLRSFTTTTVSLSLESCHVTLNFLSVYRQPLPSIFNLGPPNFLFFSSKFPPNQVATFVDLGM